MDVYSHLFPDGNREWVAKLDEPVKRPLVTGESATQPQLEPVAMGEGSAN